MTNELKEKIKKLMIDSFWVPDMKEQDLNEFIKELEPLIDEVIKEARDSSGDLRFLWW